MAVAVALLLGLAVVLATRLLMDHLRFRKLELAIPGLPSLPVLGNLLHAFSLTPDNLVATFYRLWNGRHDQLWRFGALGHLGVLVSNPDHLQELFTRKDRLDKDPFVYKFVDALGQGSINLNGAEWRAHRRALQPAFHQSVLDRYTAVFSDEAQGFVRRVRPGEAQDVDSNLQRMSARNFFRTTIAVEKESEKEVEQFLPDAELWLSTIFSSLGHRVLQPWLWPDWVFFYLTASGRTIRRLTAKVNAFCRKTVASRRAYLQQKRPLHPARARRTAVAVRRGDPRRVQDLHRCGHRHDGHVARLGVQDAVSAAERPGAHPAGGGGGPRQGRRFAHHHRGTCQAGVHGARNQGDAAAAASRPGHRPRLQAADGLRRPHDAGGRAPRRPHLRHAPRPPALARPAALRPGPLPAREQRRQAPLRLHPLQRGAQELPRRQVRYDGDEDAAGHAGAALPHRPRARRCIPTFPKGWGGALSQVHR